jgi:hypothetical protein
MPRYYYYYFYLFFIMVIAIRILYCIYIITIIINCLLFDLTRVISINSVRYCYDGSGLLASYYMKA